MLYQLEITTHCNYGCFYCAGRDMKQQHMSWELFERLLSGIPDGDNVVSLQGEGEPTVHPRFWDMVDAVRARGLRPFTITNGSNIDAARFAGSFPTIAVSVDTLDPAEAERIGRYKIDRVLKNIDELGAKMGPSRLHIMTVDYGQPLDAVREFARARGFGHTVQPLQAKDDYAKRYPGRVANTSRQYTYRCRYLEQPLRRYYDVEGREYPCCFIKDHRRHEPIETLRAKMAAREMPGACEGCHEVLLKDDVPKAVVSGTPGAAAPTLSIITACSAAWTGWQPMLAALASQPGAEVVVLDTGQAGMPRLEGPWSNVRVFRMRDDNTNLARARNQGARLARGRWVCFVDANAVLGARFREAVLDPLEPEEFVGEFGAPGLILCLRSDFLSVEGYDELLGGCEQADRDVALRLTLLGRSARPLKAGALKTSGGTGPEGGRFRGSRDRLETVADAVYVQIKRDLIREQGGRSLTHKSREAIFSNVRAAVRGAAARDEHCATVRVALPDRAGGEAAGSWGLKREWHYKIELREVPGAAGEVRPAAGRAPA